MARILFEAVAKSHGRMAALTGGSWLGVGISIGFVFGIMVYATIVCVFWRRKTSALQSQVRLSAQRGSGVASSNLANDTRMTASTGNVSSAALPAMQPPAAEDMFYSPLQSSMPKAGNVRGSANFTTLPDPALYNSHGFALVQIQTPTSMQSATLPQPETDIAAQSDTASAFLPPRTPAEKSAPQPALIQSQLSGRDVADQGVAPHQPQQPQQHQRMYSVAEAYGAEDLDDEWAVVLGDLDSLLAKKGQPGLASPERAVAVRRLIALTGSRGMHFALDAALDDVMRYRSRK